MAKMHIKLSVASYEEMSRVRFEGEGTCTYLSLSPLGHLEFAIQWMFLILSLVNVQIMMES